jgi:hypothetical protein
MSSVDAEARILLVEDNETIRRAFAILLEESGYEVLQAGSGAEALDLASRLLPDLVLMDLGLPDISGLEVTRKLKADPHTRYRDRRHHRPRAGDRPERLYRRGLHRLPRQTDRHPPAAGAHPHLHREAGRRVVNCES